MTEPKNMSPLSTADKQRRIQELQSELENLYQSLSEPLPTDAINQHRDHNHHGSDNSQDLKQINNQLLQNQQRYLTLLKNFPNGLVGLINQDLEFEFLGGSGDVHLSFRGEDLLGKRLDEVIPSDASGKSVPMIHSALAGESRIDTIEYLDETYKVYTLPVEDETGNVNGAIVMSQNITELKQAEERYRTLFHAIPDMVFILDSDLNFVLANQAMANWFGTTIDKVEGQNLLKLRPTLDKTTFHYNYQSSLDDGHPRVITGRYETDKGNHWYEARILPVPAGILVVKRDMTMQRKMNQQTLQSELKRAQTHTRDKIVRNLAHDLRTPLSIIHTSLYLIDQYNDPEKQQKKLESLKHQANLLEKMIENILLLTDLDIYDFDDLKKADVRQIIVDIVNTMLPRAQLKNIQLTVETPNHPLYDRIHASHFYRAITNIVENAIVYTPPEGKVHVQLSVTSKGIIIITVKDTGIGISSEHLPHIFEHFYRADKARTISEAGNGLGLTIAQQIIELHHGTISVRSEPKQGTEVKITI